MTTALTKAYWSAFTLWEARAEETLPYRPIEEILAVQRRRLQQMVDHAYTSVPHYRDAMDRAGLSPGDIRRADDLALLPLISGADLAADPKRFRSIRHPPAHAVPLQSSGTSGRPKVVHYDHAALFMALAHGHRQRVVLGHFVGRRFGYREMLAARSDSVSHQLRRFYESHAWVPRPVELGRRELRLDASFDDAIASVNEFRPHVIFGYGSHLGALFRWAWEHGRPLWRPSVLWYGADRIADRDRTLIEGELGVPVVSTYQCDEVLRLGFQCERREGFHLSLDAVAVRVVDRDGNAVGPGGTGEIVISTLTNRATVLLNYKLGDIVTMGASPCACGRTLPTIRCIQGRAEDVVLLRGGEMRHPLVLLQDLRAVRGIVEVQLVQDTLERFSLRAVCAAGSHWETIRAQLGKIVRRLLGEGLDVAIERVDSIPREPGGKVRSVISRCRTSA